MMKRHLPSVEALTSNDDELLRTELRLSEARQQVELARSLLEEIEAASDRPSARAKRDAAAEELARLGYRMVEIASVLSKASVLPASGTPCSPP